MGQSLFAKKPFGADGFMKIYFSGDTIEYPNPAIALGNFDGMHRGHLHILERAKEYGGSFGVLLFEQHTSAVLGGGVQVITPLYEKLEILSETGVDFVYMVNFDESFRNMSCGEFCSFISEIGAKSVSVGYDYRFGKNASGDAALLRTLLEGYGIYTITSEAVMADGEPVKSSRIRSLIKDGDICAANALMGRPLRRSGIVVSGFQNGRKMGFPTANLECPRGVLLPPDGVYYGECTIGGAHFCAVVNIGKNPTFNAEKRTIEAHIIDYCNDLYGDRLAIDFYERIRGEKRFDSINDLKRQIAEDKEYAKRRGKV